LRWQRELIDLREEELLGEIQETAAQQTSLLQQAKENKHAKAIELSLDTQRFLGDIDGCFQSITNLTVNPSDTDVAVSPAMGSPSMLPRDLRGLKGSSAQPHKLSGRTPLRERSQAQAPGSSGRKQQLQLRGSLSVSAADLDLGSELSPSPGRSSFGSSSGACSPAAHGLGAALAMAGAAPGSAPRLVNLPLGASAADSSTISTPSKTRRMDSFRKC
jgi:hypothetical protein